MKIRVFQFCTIGFIAFCFLKCESQSRQKVIWANNVQIFESTPVWRLAKAVCKQDTLEIRRLIVGGADVNFQENKFGSTLLMFSIRTRLYLSFKTLLLCGANPNIHDKNSGKSAMIHAAEIPIIEDPDLMYLRFLVANRGDVNDVEVGSRGSGNTTRLSVLIAACEEPVPERSPIAKVKYLVEMGANVNFVNEYNFTALRASLTFKKYDVILFLLEKGADFRTPFRTVNGREIFICDKLKYGVFPLGSTEHRQKRAVVDFLRGKGVDCDLVPVPNPIIEEIKELYPDSWENYLKEY